MTEINRAELSRLLEAEVYMVQPEPILTGGKHSRVFACRSAAGELVLRICEGRQGFYTHYFPEKVKWDEWMDQHWAIEAAQATGVPAPEIVISDSNRRWVIMKRLQGVPIDARYEAWQGCPYDAVSYTHLRAHETRHDLVCRLLLEKKKKKKNEQNTETKKER